MYNTIHSNNFFLEIVWARDTDCAFAELESGFENALRNYQKIQIQMLNSLIELLMGQLNKGDRQKIMTVCTIDVHSRDVVAKMIAQKVRTHLSFQWQQQLRHRWDEKENDCFVNICDAEFRYWFEYLGNSPRLVVNEHHFTFVSHPHFDAFIHLSR